MYVRKPSMLSLVAGVLVLFAGCASPGPPRPPSLNLPKPPEDLTAERIGDEVHLHWTSPTDTTDGTTVRGPLTAVLCRALMQPGIPETCQPIHRQPARAGSSEIVDRLPVSLMQNPARLVLYRVQLLNRTERAASPSTPAFVAGGPAPEPVAALTAQSAPEGAILRWHPGLNDVSVELRRTAFASPRSKASTEVLLSVEENSAVSTETGVALDPTAQPGLRYTYTAQRVRTLILAGHSLELRSTPSAPATLELRDTFPPRTPDALEAVTDTTNPATPAVDLSWHPNTETDLAGYLVFRQENGQPVRQITSSPTPSPGFRDASVLPGHTYLYTVLAVDQTGNRSKPSEPVSAKLP